MSDSPLRSQFTPSRLQQKHRGRPLRIGTAEPRAEAAAVLSKAERSQRNASRGQRPRPRADVLANGECLQQTRAKMLAPSQAYAEGRAVYFLTPI